MVEAPALLELTTLVGRQTIKKSAVLENRNGPVATSYEMGGDSVLLTGPE